MPVRRSMISANTQCSDVAWYSNFVPGSQFNRHFLNASSRPSRVYHAGAPSGAIGKPPMCRNACSTVICSFPFVANSGMMSPTRSSSRNRPSSMSVHAAAETIPFVLEKIVYIVSSVAGRSSPPWTALPNTRKPASLPRLAIATEALGSEPSSTSLRARAKTASSFSLSIPTSSGFVATNSALNGISAPSSRCIARRIHERCRLVADLQTGVFAR